MKQKQLHFDEKTKTLWFDEGVEEIESKTLRVCGTRVSCRLTGL